MTVQSNNALIKFGVLLPTREAVMSGRSDPSLLYQIAERAEVLGFNSIWVGDSLTARPRIDALTTLAAVGARTSRVRLGTAILLAALRHPVLLAHQLASLDWMAGGRIDLGIGFGRRGEASQEHEFKILGLDPRARMKMSEEAVHIMRRLWRENDVAYEGVFTRFEHVTIEPKPAQAGGVPIWMASNDIEAGLRRVGRLGDAWMNNIKDPETYRIAGRRFAPMPLKPGEIPTAFNRAPILPSLPVTRMLSLKAKSFSRSTTTVLTKPSSRRRFASRDPGTKFSTDSRLLSTPALARWYCALPRAISSLNSKSAPRP
jgi:alkanesulfonate monooxygenase SsuD/methylene tetrahydromethanopterin reductase-like flavin-dependent oxidoreductase (luciferase family)